MASIARARCPAAQPVERADTVDAAPHRLLRIVNVPGRSESAVWSAPARATTFRTSPPPPSQGCSSRRHATGINTTFTPSGAAEAWIRTGARFVGCSGIQRSLCAPRIAWRWAQRGPGSADQFCCRNSGTGRAALISISVCAYPMISAGGAAIAPLASMTRRARDTAL